MTDRKIILYAEDNEAVRRRYERILQRRFPEPEYSVETFEDGSSLKARLDSYVGNVSVVVLDETLPGVTGDQIIKTYARREGFEHIPFILFTSEIGLIGKVALLNGAFAHVDKLDPIDKLLMTAEYALNPNPKNWTV